VSSCAIYLCKSCKDYADDFCNYPSELRRESIFKIKHNSVEFEKHKGYFHSDTAKEFFEAHEGHELYIVDDGAGTYSGYEFNFEQDKFVYTR